MQSMKPPKISRPIEVRQELASPFHQRAEVGPKPVFAKQNVPNFNQPQSQPRAAKKISIEDFETYSTLGEGGFGKVFLVRKRTNSRYYAMKRVAKSRFVNQDFVEQAITEKEVMRRASHPFIVKLHYSFQNSRYLYYVMDWMEGGPLFEVIRRFGRLSEEAARFYASEVLLALKYLHENLGVIYRDLKPDNVLLDREGHIRLTDFGLSKSKLTSRSQTDKLHTRNSRVHRPRNSAGA